MGATTANNNNNNNNSNASQGYGGGEIDKKAMKKVVDKVALTNAAATAVNNELQAGNQMYGGAVDKAINDKLEQLGYGTPTGGGGTMLTPEGWKMKYGSYTPGQAQTGAAMGTGNPGGALTSTAISSEMLKSQNKTKGLMVGAASFAMPGIGKSLMRIDAGKALADAAAPKEAYEDYKAGFDAKMSKKAPPKKRTLLTSLADAATNIDAKIKTKLGQ